LGNVGGGGSSLGAPTTVADGTIKIGTTTTGAALRYTGTGSTSDRVIDLAGTTGGATLDQSGSGLWKFTSNLTATGAGKKTLTLTGSTAGIGEIGGAIVDNALINTTTVVKAGSGTWVLSGTNTYRGFTVISNGTLRINGMLTAAGNGSIVTNIAGTLGGNGTIERTVVIRNGATISPGASIGTLTVSNLTLQSGALLSYELGAIASSDKIIATGTLALGGLEFSQFTWTTLGGFTAGDYTLIDAAGLSGSLGSLTNGFIGGIAAGLWLDTANNNLMLTVIPEPGSLLLVGAGLAFFLVMRRRR
jgi:autotransporter-associated beta strand protein